MGKSLGHASIVHFDELMRVVYCMILCYMLGKVYMGNERVSILVVAYALLIEQGERNLNFLFDICRWQVEEGDRGVAHEVMTDYHLFFTNRPL